MNWIDTYRLRFLKKQAAKVKRNLRLPDIDQIQKVGILWNENEEKAFKFLYDKFKSQKVHIRHLCSTTDKTAKDSNMITPRDINWLGFPKSGTFREFIQSDFDILINLSVIPDYALEYITAVSAASMKIGWDYRQCGIIDISVDVSKQPDAMYLAEQLVFYLKQLNKKIDL